MAKGKDIDARAAADRIAAVAGMGQTAWDPKHDDIDESGSDFRGMVLFSDMIVGGELEVTTQDVYVEEPRIVADEDDDDNEDERSLWGDGDPDPAEAQGNED